MSAPENEPQSPEKPMIEWQDMSVEELAAEGEAIYDRQRGMNGREADATAKDIALLPAATLREMRRMLDHESSAEKTRSERRLNHIETMQRIITQALGG